MIVVLLPAYNEASGIKQLLGRIRVALASCAYQIVIVDDGSTDGTKEVIAKCTEREPITLLSHPLNLGLGKAMETGILYTCSHFQDNDVLVTMDADSTHDPETIKQIVEKVESGADVVIASRFVEKGTEIGVPLYRRLLSRGVRILFRVIFPHLKVKDCTSGYRGYRISLFKRALDIYQPFVTSRGFAVTPELLLKLSRLRPVVLEVPLMLHYDDKAGKSKMRILSTMIEYGKMIIDVKRGKVYS